MSIVKAAFIGFVTVGCTTTIPAGTPSALIPLGNRQFADFQFRVAPPASDADVSTCRQEARPESWAGGFMTSPAIGSGAAPQNALGGAVTVYTAARAIAEHRRQANVFAECLTRRGYVVERVDEAPKQAPNSSDFGSGR